MFYKEFLFDNKKVIVSLSQLPIFESEDSWIFGFMIGKFDIKHLNINELKNNAGYYLYLSIEEDRLIAFNDITGGFRTYYHDSKDFCIISDKWENVQEVCKRYTSDFHLTVNSNQLKFWNTHRYTIGDRTFYNEIKKIAPWTKFIFSKSGVASQSLFDNNLNSSSDRQLHTKSIYSDLKRNFQFLRDNYSEEKTILLFSGGRDSVYLSKILLEVGIDFTPVFFAAIPSYKENYHDLIKAKRAADELGIKLNVIQLNITIIEQEIDKIVNDLKFDRHFGILHYLGAKEIAKQYGKDCIVINGQGSDSIFSFGPSENNLGCFLRRSILYLNKWLYILPKFLLEWRTGFKFRIPKSKMEKFIGFCDERSYVFLPNLNYDPDYERELECYIEDLILLNDDDCVNLMKLKINTFLQGSDNQVSIKSAQAYGINRVFLPFCTPTIINSTMAFKSKWFELFYPKYVVPKISNVQSISSNIDDNSFHLAIKSLEEQVNKYFSNSLML